VVVLKANSHGLMIQKRHVIF